MAHCILHTANNYLYRLSLSLLQFQPTTFIENFTHPNHINYKVDLGGYSFFILNNNIKAKTAMVYHNNTESLSRHHSQLILRQHKWSVLLCKRLQACKGTPPTKTPRLALQSVQEEFVKENH